MTNITKSFASDNNAGVHPQIMEALARANQGHCVGYGADHYTTEATRSFKDIFGQETDVYFVFNGTAANVIGLSAVLQSHQAIICAESAHLAVDECGAPEKFIGSKLLTVPAPNGKISVESINRFLHGVGFEHHVQPRAISITQSTELGTVYTVEEIKEISRFAKKNNFYLHMDGARICNAAASLNTDLVEITKYSGIDILSFGGTKNGLMYGEAILFFNKNLSSEVKYIRKQAMQLGSKMRFISAQFSALLQDELWRRNALHANKMAQLLEQKVANIKGVTVNQSVQTNAVFATIPRAAIPLLQKEYFFYVWDEDKSEVRWMTSFDTTEADITRFVDILKRTLAQ